MSDHSLIALASQNLSAIEKSRRISHILIEQFNYLPLPSSVLRLISDWIHFVLQSPQKNNNKDI